MFCDYVEMEVAATSCSDCFCDSCKYPTRVNPVLIARMEAMEQAEVEADAQAVITRNNLNISIETYLRWMEVFPREDWYY